MAASSRTTPVTRSSRKAPTTVVSGAPLTQQVTATAPAGDPIAYFDLIADAPDNSEGKYLAIDDVSITTPDGPQPPDLTLNPGQTVVDVLTARPSTSPST